MVFSNTSTQKWYIYLYVYIYIHVSLCLKLNLYIYICLEEGIIYEATIKSSSDEKKYVGLTEGTFKRRLYDHRQSFKNSGLRNATELSKHIWDLNDRGEKYELSWNIIDRASSYKGTSKSCRLCLLEKYHILTREDLLNKRSELVSKCRHRRPYLIGSVR